MIEFNFSEESEQTLIFGDVKDDEFFVNSLGYLCQKINDDQYIIIADPDGYPTANCTLCGCGAPISRIIGKPNKIIF